MGFVKPKKELGQHFLLDESISEKIAHAVMGENLPKVILEIGPGTGALTKYFFKNPLHETYLIEIDSESVDYLKKIFPEHSNRIFHADFLHSDLNLLFQAAGSQPEVFTVVGNFPYNISSQILFKVLENKAQIPLVVGMFQKEVAKRIASKPGKREYGILSVFMQAFYRVEYMFDVPPSAFNPPPNVDSGVLSFKRIEGKVLSCDLDIFFRTVKTAFNQRRKTLRNALSSILPLDFPKDHPFLKLRAEQLSSDDFELLSSMMRKM